MGRERKRALPTPFQKGRIGRPMTYDAVRSLVHRLSKKTGIWFTPHMFRHTRATIWLRDEKQQRLQEHLTGMWAHDVWELSWKGGRRQLRFTMTSTSLKTEVKYGVWFRFESGKRTLGGDQRSLCADVEILIGWINTVAPEISSLLEKSLEHWELSLRSYLIETNRLKQERRRHLLATQQYAQHVIEDRRIGLLRQLYIAIANAYDDRSEMERDVWDMRKLGLSMNPTISAYYLNFTLISQPWLRCLAKAFLQYRIAVYSPADCLTKMNAIRAFSRFLAQRFPGCQASDIDRALIVTYMGVVREGGKSVIWRNQLLSNLCSPLADSWSHERTYYL